MNNRRNKAEWQRLIGKRGLDGLIELPQGEGGSRLLPRAALAHPCASSCCGAAAPDRLVLMAAELRARRSL